tara:strand:+ start:802 stop:1137 length:336 start_codon:yes stop_codon:yes gene_type:complete
MDYRIRRFLISAAVIFIAALLFLWAMHWMGKGINRVNSPPDERSFQGDLIIAAKSLKPDRIVHGLEQQPCGVPMVEGVELVDNSLRILTFIEVTKLASSGAGSVLGSPHAT